MINRPLRPHARRGSVYLAVTGTSILVSLIGFTALHLSRLELRTTTARNESNYARQLAHTGVEFALARIEWEGAFWRSTHSHGVEVTATPAGTSQSVAYRLLDNGDSDLNNDSTNPVEIQGIGRYRSATYVYSVTYAPSVTPEDLVSEQVLKNYYSGASPSATPLRYDRWRGQYFLPTFPAEAVSWTVTSIEVKIKNSGFINSTLDVSLYLPDGSLLPGTLIEKIAVPEGDLPTVSDVWDSYAFGSVSGLDPAVGLCLTLSTTLINEPAEVPIEPLGAVEANAHLLTSSGSSWGADPNQSLHYRVRGFYSTSEGTGEFAISPGSWQRIESP